MLCDYCSLLCKTIKIEYTEPVPTVIWVMYPVCIGFRCCCHIICVNSSGFGTDNVHQNRWLMIVYAFILFGDGSFFILTLTKEWNINGEKVVFGVEKM